MAAAFDFLGLSHRIAKQARAIAARGDGRELVGSTNSLGQGTIRADKDLEDMVIGELKASGIPCTLATEEAGLVEISANPEWRFVLDPLDGSENYKRGVPPYSLGICYAPEGGSLGDVRESFVCDLVSGDEFYARAGSGVVLRNGVKTVAGKAKRLSDAVLSADFYCGNRGPRDAETHALLREVRDARRLGSGLIEMAYVCCGGADGYLLLNPLLSAVHASGVGLMREACVLTDERGGKLDCPLEVDAKFGFIAACTKELHAGILDALKRGDKNGGKIRLS